MNSAVTRPNLGRHRWAIAVGLLLLLLAGVGLGEWMGWPFLAVPLQHMLSNKLDRHVSFSSEMNASFAVRFIGGIRLHAARLEIGVPTWSKAPHLLLAKDMVLELRYADIWHAYRGQPLRIHKLQAVMLDANLERLADGRATWQSEHTSIPAQPLALPLFDNLQVTSGTLRYRDVPLAIDVVATLSLSDSDALAISSQATGSKPSEPDQDATVLQVKAKGYYRNLPLKIEMVSSGSLPSAVNQKLTLPVVMTLNAIVGHAKLDFKGRASDALSLSEFSGSFSLQGPSLADMGDPLGVTLPTTSEFRIDGAVARQGSTWRVQADHATIGASSLNGDFTYEKSRSVPLLSGKLGGSKLLLTDLGPALGTKALDKATLDKRALEGNALSKKVSNKTLSTKLAADKKPGSNGKKILPDRRFDLPALRAMDADVLVDISYVDLNTSILEPLRQLRTHLQLAGGILTLSDIETRTAQGRLTGKLSLDGRASTALWDADLRWSDVHLEHWIHQTRSEGSPPYISGRMNGQAILHGTGRSTAEILASLKGHARTELHNGALSHLAIEAAGLDIAQALGVLVEGDKDLPLQCAVVDLTADSGVFRPKVMVLDTEDSTVWVDGSLSLASETLNLRAVVMPKDFSPMTLRAPLHVGGSFASPEVSLEKKPMSIKLASSFLLALVNPLAALIPLFDTGDSKDAKQAAALCHSVMQRSTIKSVPSTT